MIAYPAPVAVLYQAQPPPIINGISKPMKPGGYADSGADIAFTLQKAGVAVVTPVANPSPSEVWQWGFADTLAGIQQALNAGAQVLWLNTVLYGTHPIEQVLNQGVWVVGQVPKSVELYDNKWYTNQWLKRHRLPIPEAITINQPVENQLTAILKAELTFPVIAKPIRGRGSAGVTLVHTQQQLITVLSDLLASLEFGDTIMIEDYLPGQEITLTIMPPGTYQINGQQHIRSTHWCLPPVRRFNHQNGVAPYNGTVAVMANSQVLDDAELATRSVQTVMRQCEQAAKLVDAKAPIRIDCRQDTHGTYYLFDLNMKPNMTGAGRPGRNDQDSLSAMAASKIGWTYQDLLLNMLRQAWRRNIPA